MQIRNHNKESRTKTISYLDSCFDLVSRHVEPIVEIPAPEHKVVIQNSPALQKIVSMFSIKNNKSIREQEIIERSRSCWKNREEDDFRHHLKKMINHKKDKNNIKY
jgi:hypothetical protein